MDPWQHAYVAHPAVLQKGQQHVEDVARLVRAIERTAKSFGLRRIEDRRQRKTELASRGGIEGMVRADYRDGLANRRAHLTYGAAREELSRDFALRRPSLLQCDAQTIGC